MSISEEVTFDKEGHIERFPWVKKVFLSLVIILVASLSFGIGRLSVVGKREPIKIEFDPSLAGNSSPSVNVASQSATVINSQTKPAPLEAQLSNGVVASKNSNKYHFSHCPGAKQIKDANKITFDSPKSAESAGYVLASNCKP